MTSEFHYCSPLPLGIPFKICHIWVMFTSSFYQDCLFYEVRVSRNVRPKTWKPKTRKPKTWKPKTQKPKTWKPKTRKPKTWKPKTRKPKTRFVSGFLHSYSQLMSRVTSIFENEMNMFKIICKCRTLQRAILMFISFSEILVTRDVDRLYKQIKVYSIIIRYWETIISSLLQSC